MLCIYELEPNSPLLRTMCSQAHKEHRAHRASCVHAAGKSSSMVGTPESLNIYARACSTVPSFMVALHWAPGRPRHRGQWPRSVLPFQTCMRCASPSRIMSHWVSAVLFGLQCALDWPCAYQAKTHRVFGENQRDWSMHLDE